MDSKMKGVLLGVGGIVLWFSPFTSFQFMGLTVTQSGQHIGGIAYLLLLASCAYAALSWVQQYQLALVAASVATGICALFAVQAGSSIAWGLIALLVLSIISIVLARRSQKALSNRQEAAAEPSATND